MLVNCAAYKQGEKVADIALRDFGLLLAALTLFRLASAYSGRAPNVDHVR